MSADAPARRPGRPRIHPTPPDLWPPAVKLRRMVAARGTSLRRLQAETGLSYRCVWGLVNGRIASPGPETVRKVLRALGSDEAEFYGL